ncbi:MAG: hypothetical protein ACRDNS_25980, partial [Trebonia sp.]
VHATAHVTAYHTAYAAAHAAAAAYAAAADHAADATGCMVYATANPRLVLDTLLDAYYAHVGRPRPTVPVGYSPERRLAEAGVWQ